MYLWLIPNLKDIINETNAYNSKIYNCDAMFFENIYYKTFILFIIIGF